MAARPNIENLAGDIVTQAQEERRLHERRRRELSEQTARAVVEAGGVTEMDTFIFAMHGILPYGAMNEREEIILEKYQNLSARFGRLRPRTPVAEKIGLGGDGPTVWRIGLPYEVKHSKSSLKFDIKPATSGYQGGIELPVRDEHVYHYMWNHDSEASTRLERHESAEFRLAYAFNGNHSDGRLQDYSSSFTVGMKELYAIRELGMRDDIDRQFLGAIAIFRANALDEPGFGLPGDRK